MSRWFRFYDDAVNDPKVQALPGDIFKSWVNLLCLASKCDGLIKSTAEAAWWLRKNETKSAEIIKTLVAASLLDELDDGIYTPHNWKDRQYQSDSSSERVQRHRDKRAAAGLAPQWQPSPALRADIYARDGRKCVYCASTDDLTIDHRTPEMRGGTHEPENLQTACRRCNASKRDLTHEEFVTRSDNGTLLKRPQSTEQNTTEKKDGASAPPVDEDADLFRRGKQVLGAKAGSLIARLKLAKGGSISHARAVIEQASTKQNPREYVGAAIAGNRNGTRNLQPNGEPFPDGII